LQADYANGIVAARADPFRAHQTPRPLKIFDRVLNPREIRRRLGLNQEQFWTQIGVTQSGGSRYESGRDMPKPVRELLRLVHVEQVEIISYLKETHPDLYRSLKRAARGRGGSGLADVATFEPGDDLIDLPAPAHELPRGT
jgi:DNA-binding transcriptional regulator YiaG